MTRAIDQRWRGLVALLLVASTLVACSQEPPADVQSPSVAVDQTDVEVWDQLFDSVQADSSDQDPATRAILDDIAATGDVTREHLDEAATNAMDCMEAAGISPQFTAPSNSLDSYEIAWWFDLGVRNDARADELDMIGQACVDTYYTLVEILYWQRPAAIAMREDRTVQELPSIRDCLAGTAHELDAEATIDEHFEALHSDFLAREDESCLIELDL